ncbi:MAG: hypothetical protein WKF74_12220 [Pyrinomonadaceae bacterium]
MNNNAGLMQVVWAFPLIVTMLFWQSESCRKNPQANANAKSQSANVERSDAVLKGIWGGQHVSMEVTADGATIEYDCAHGAINEPLVVDRNGKFDVKGTFEIERPGPQRAGQASEARPARYSGTIDGKKMTLNVTLTDKNESAGTFTLSHGVMPQIVKCL